MATLYSKILTYEMLALDMCQVLQKHLMVYHYQRPKAIKFLLYTTSTIYLKFRVWGSFKLYYYEGATSQITISTGANIPERHLGPICDQLGITKSKCGSKSEFVSNCVTELI